MVVLIDIDGVLADFCGSVCEVLNKKLPDPYPHENYNISDALGVSESELWKAVDAHGYDFWANLKPYDYAQELYERLKSEYDVYFCSSPSRSPESLQGKLIWLNRFVKGTCRNYVFTPHKKLLFRPDHILIDDYQKNTDEFQDRGVLFPQNWNANWKYKSDQMKYVFQHVEYISYMMDTYWNAKEEN